MRNTCTLLGIDRERSFDTWHCNWTQTSITLGPQNGESQFEWVENNLCDSWHTGPCSLYAHYRLGPYSFDMLSHENYNQVRRGLINQPIGGCMHSSYGGWWRGLYERQTDANDSRLEPIHRLMQPGSKEQSGCTKHQTQHHSSCWQSFILIYLLMCL